MSASVDDFRCVALGQTTNDWLVSRALDGRRPHVVTWSRASAEGRRPHVVIGVGTLETTVEALHIAWSVPATGRRAAAGDVGSFDTRSLGGSWFAQSDTG